MMLWKVLAVLVPHCTCRIPVRSTSTPMKCDCKCRAPNRYRRSRECQARTPKMYQTSLPLVRRARTYFIVNCSQTCLYVVVNSTNAINIHGNPLNDIHSEFCILIVKMKQLGHSELRECQSASRSHGRTFWDRKEKRFTMVAINWKLKIEWYDNGCND